MKNFLEDGPMADRRSKAISTAALPHCTPWLSAPVERDCVKGERGGRSEAAQTGRGPPPVPGGARPVRGM